VGYLLFLILIVLFTFNCRFKRALAWKFLYKRYHWQFLHRLNCVRWWVCLSGHSFSLPFTLIRGTTQFPWYTVYNIFKIICWMKRLYALHWLWYEITSCVIAFHEYNFSYHLFSNWTAFIILWKCCLWLEVLCGICTEIWM
jgi:hypothetical protein